MKEKISKSVLAFQIITAVLFVIAAAFSIIFFIDVMLDPDGIGKAIGLSLWIIFAFAALLIPLIISIIGLIVAIVKKCNKKVGVWSIIYFIIFTVLPVITYLVMLLIIQNS